MRSDIEYLALIRLANTGIGRQKRQTTTEQTCDPQDLQFSTVRTGICWIPLLIAHAKLVDVVMEVISLTNENSNV